MGLVVTNGCFDPLTGSHVAFLGEAAMYGDRLVIALARDAVVTRLRGAGRPFLPFEHRHRVLTALRVVTYVVGYDTEEELAALYANLRPAVLAKGAAWEGQTLTGQTACGHVVFLREQSGHASDFLRAYLEAAAPPASDRLRGPAIEIVLKAWGEEWIFARHAAYAGKLLRVAPGRQSSLHRHRVKDETFFVLSGVLRVQTSRRIGPVYEQRDLVPGDSLRVTPGTWHRFANAAAQAVVEVVEASTRDDPEDSERAEPSCPYREEDWR